MNKNNTQSVNMVEFNAEAAKNGAKVVTRLGFPVKFITITNDGKVFAQIEHGPMYSRTPEKFNMDGKKYSGTEHANDLFIAA